MNCEDYRAHLLQHLDGSPAEDALENHIGQCPHCEALLDASQRLTAALGLWQRPTLPPGFTERVVIGVLTDQRRQRRVRRSARLYGRLAASLLLAAGVTYCWPQEQPIPPSPVAQHAEPLSPETTATLRDSVNQAGQAVSQFTMRSADTTVGQTRSFWPAVTPGLDEWEKQPPNLEPPTRQLQETGQSAVAALEPVTDSARRTFGMLLHDLQPLEQPAKPKY